MEMWTYSSIPLGPTPIPFDHPKVIDAKALIPEEFHAKAWIAGSAACRYPEAWDAGGDLDIWICGLSMAWRLKGLSEWDRAYQLIGGKVEDRPETDAAHEYSQNAILVHRGERLHILISSVSIAEIIEGFDLACHSAAVPLLGPASAAMTTPDFGPVKIRSWKEPTKTLERGIKFVRRYQQYMQPSEFWTDDQTFRCMLQAAGVNTEIGRQEFINMMWLKVQEGL